MIQHRRYVAHRVRPDGGGRAERKIVILTAFEAGPKPADTQEKVRRYAPRWLIIFCPRADPDRSLA